MTEPLTIAWLTVYDWGHEFAGVEGGTIPSHRLLGAAELQLRGHHVMYLTRPARARRWVPWRLAQLSWLLRHQGRVDAIVATHEAAALPALAARRLGLLRRPTVVLSVAAAMPRATRSAERLETWALRGASVINVFARVQIETVKKRLGRKCPPVVFTPLGVDVDFFRGQRPCVGEVIVSVGTNPGKDYPTLIRALRPGERCVIVTDPANRAAAEAVLERDHDVTFQANLDMTSLRRLYAGAKVVVIPLRDVPFSSGQTVLLESLACGTPVVTSLVPAMRDYLGPGVRAAEPGDADDLRLALDAISEADAAPERAENFTISALADRIEELVHAAMVHPGRARGPV